jgi:hypothetical protein
MPALSRYAMEEALRLAVTARKRGKHALHNPIAFENVFHGQLNEIPKAVLELARLLVDTKFTRVEQFESWMDEFNHEGAEIEYAKVIK